MSNPSQPSFTWQIYSYDLEPFGSFFGVKKACEPVHIQMNQNDFHVMVINNTAGPVEGLTASVCVLNLDGAMRAQKQIPVNAKASTSTDLGAIDFPQDLSPVHFVKVELRDARNQIVSDNFYWRGSQADDLTALDTIATAGLDAKLVRRDARGKCLVDVTLTNSSNVVAVMAHLQLRKEQSNQRVLPVYYSDNYVSLLPGESRTISIEAAARDLAGDSPRVVLDGWNVTTKSQRFVGMNGPASIAPNADAMVTHAPAP
jgi:beta-mannosidase